ncbi:MAG: Fe-S cluster assembly protein HesB [Candidatus Dormibacteraeota bacterium]|nr:Fe-S cluster assembly protein HesB [Candidatus Dormibacteraeota bacterium]
MEKISWTGSAEADHLLETEPLALLIGLVLDQQVKMEKAFSGPYDLKQRLGSLDARRIAELDPAELDRVFRERPALHRFPGNMARRVQLLCQVLVERYEGDAAAVWTGVKSGEELAARIAALPGFGEQKTRITVSILAKKFDVKPKGWEAHAANWHTVADVDSPETMAEARAVKREMKAGMKAGTQRNPLR